MITTVRVHLDASDTDTLITMDEQVAADFSATLDRMTQGRGWAQVPPVGSDWEAADWDALAHRMGVA